MVSHGRGSVFQRRLLATTNTILQGLLVLWIALQLNVIGYQRSWRFDLTRDSVYKVTDAMRKVLAQLPRDRRVDVVIPFGVPPNIEGQLHKALFARAFRVCREFEMVNPAFHVADLIDVNRTPHAWQEARTRWGIDQPNRIHLLYDDMRVAMTVN